MSSVMRYRNFPFKSSNSVDIKNCRNSVLQHSLEHLNQPFIDEFISSDIPKLKTSISLNELPAKEKASCKFYDIKADEFSIENDCCDAPNREKQDQDNILNNSDDSNFHEDRRNVNAENKIELLKSMKHEINRLKSFENKWPLDFIKPTDLAAVGLFYLNIADKVQCAFCKGVIMDWTVGDKPLTEHMRHFPFCPFLMNQDVGNVPISTADPTWQVRFSHPELLRSYRNGAPDRVTSVFSPKYPTMAAIEKRLETYKNWPSGIAVTKELLAECGFYYSGVHDVVTCFACGGTLGSWERDDNPWEEHAKHFPSCQFLKNHNSSVSAVNEQTRATDEAYIYISNNTEECPSIENLVINNDDDSMNKESQSSSNGSASNEQCDMRLCKICMDKERGVVFLPCGHLVACTSCARLISQCPLCRTTIKSVVRAYMS